MAVNKKRVWEQFIKILTYKVESPGLAKNTSQVRLLAGVDLISVGVFYGLETIAMSCYAQL
ncbi:hypothetical protein [Chroococcidiopsis sp. CCMEE 29]|uniref:hypothetical protein n=1 Tax=Chroococcidiopsis sp. CCMEE 29 TaxID=155894 RepID=UPI002021ED1A|nr:hypothetical protein [Chroococcidiopsis sp. CCMEE 29]